MFKVFFFFFFDIVNFTPITFLAIHLEKLLVHKHIILNFHDKTNIDIC